MCPTIRLLKDAVDMFFVGLFTMRVPGCKEAKRRRETYHHKVVENAQAQQVVRRRVFLEQHLAVLHNCSVGVMVKPPQFYSAA